MRAKDSVRDFVISELKFSGSVEDLTDDYPLIQREVIDSLGIYSIVGFLEEEFGIEIDEDDLVPDNFESLRSIGHLVEAKQKT